MKMSNFMLFIISMLVLFGAITSTNFVLSKNSTAVISIPLDDVTSGGGLNMEMPKSLSQRQAHILGMAYSIAKKDGHQYPQLLQGIVLQETKAGGMQSYKVAGQEFGLRPNERYYGVTQIKLAAARDVLQHYPKMSQDFEFQTKTDEEVIAKLIENDEFNLSVASKYLLLLKSFGYNTAKQLALAYNQGPGGAKGKDPDTHHYSSGVMAYIQKLPAK